MRMIGPVVLLVLLNVPAALAQDTELGHTLVTDNCAGCHAVEATGDSPLAQAPAFRDLHERYDVEFLTEALVEGIVTAHEGMPEFTFSPDEAASIVAYLKTLEPATGAN